MLLNVLDDVFLLHLPLEATERAFDRFTVLHLNFSQNFLPPPLRSERYSLDIRQLPRARRVNVLGLQRVIEYQLRSSVAACRPTDLVFARIPF